ncbi:acyltransferase family protein [Kocuria kalidii]|uniref:acyltransferase family protein n=1 Tax=Kocuria kalidii TaxID=3376283 RepID=UPI0037B12C44
MHSTPDLRVPQNGQSLARPQIVGLTGIRALAAAWVVIEHFRYALFGLFPGSRPAARFIESGFLGVEIFFVLSGFIIAYTYAHKFEKFTWGKYRRFMLLRFARIYPVHLVTLLAVLALVVAAAFAGIELNSSEGHTPGNFIANVLMLQSVPPFSPWNLPAWSICAEFAAYLAFPLVAVWVARINSARHGFVAAGAVLVVGAALLLVIAAYVNSSPTGYELIWARISIEFTAGTLIYAGWRHLGTGKQGPWWDWAAGASFLAILVVIYWTNAGSAFVLAAVPFIGVFVLSCAGATGLVGRFLGSRLMVWGGKISYSVYMTHFVLLMVFGKLLPWEAFVDGSLVARVGILGGYYVAVIIAGAVGYYLVEEPARQAIRKIVEAKGGMRAPKITHPTPVL